MPIYQYDCPSCQKRVDVFFRSISKVAANPVCPECGGKKLKRVMSRVLRARSDADRIDDIDINQELGRLDSMG
ncbi:MAG: zinc ribbon domain-containing protein, partial [Dehalococcoidia bacterium]